MSSAPGAPTGRGLGALLSTQFLGAFNDNAWRLIVTFLAIRALGPGATEADAQGQTTLATIALTVPLILFSFPAGVLSDRFSKRSVIVSMKLVELALMSAATYALWVSPTGGTLAWVVLAAMGAQSALFSPAKYGIMPELVPHQRLSMGNGLLEMYSTLAIIAGTVAGGLVLDAVGAATWMAGGLLTLFAVAGGDFGGPNPDGSGRGNAWWHVQDGGRGLAGRTSQPRLVARGDRLRGFLARGERAVPGRGRLRHDPARAR